MSSYIEHQMPPEPVQCRYNLAIVVAAALILVFFLAFFTSKKLRMLLGCSLLACFSRIRSDKTHIIEEQARTISSLQATVKAKNVHISALETDFEGQKGRLESELSSSQAETQAVIVKAAADLAQKDKEMRALTRDCHRVLDPHREYPDDMSVHIVATFAAARRGKLERDIERRESALGDGELVEEVKKMKKISKDQVRVHERVVREKEERISELVEANGRLEEEMVDQKSRIEALNEQLDELMKTKIELNGELSRTNHAFGEEKTRREELEKVVLLKNQNLDDAARESVRLATQFQETREAMEAESKKFNTVLDDYEKQYEEVRGECRVAELRGDNLRRKLDTVMRELDQEKLRWSKEGNVHKTSDAANGKGKEKLEPDAGERSEAARQTVSEPTQPQIPIDHKEGLKAAAEREAELAKRLKAAESAKATLEKQLTEAANASQALDLKAQTLRGQIIDLAKALNGSLPESVTSSDCLRWCLQELHRLSDAVTVAAQNQETELRTLREKDTTSEIELRQLREKDANSQKELQELRKMYDTSLTRIKDVNTGRAEVKRLLTAKEAECRKLQSDFQKELRDAKLDAARHERTATAKESERLRLRDLLTAAERDGKSEHAERERLDEIIELRDEQLEGEKQKRRDLKATLASTVGELTEKEVELYLVKKEAELQLAEEAYSHQEHAAVERDLARTRAIFREKARVSYDLQTLDVLRQLVKCNNDLGELRATLQDPEDEHTREALRDIIRNSEIDGGDIKALKQTVPRLTEQAWKANFRVAELNKILDAAEEAAVEGDEKAGDDCEKALFYKLIEPRGDEDSSKSTDVNMA